MTVSSDRGTFLEYITACSLIHPFHPLDRSRFYWSRNLISQFNCPIELSKNVSRSVGRSVDRVSREWRTWESFAVLSLCDSDSLSLSLSLSLCDSESKSGVRPRELTGFHVPLGGPAMLNWTPWRRGPITKNVELAMDQIAITLLRSRLTVFHFISDSSVFIPQIWSKAKESRIFRVWHDCTWISALHA